jgi:cholesterol oxidase
MKSVYDVVVIGSGFGGAITAYNLAKAGLSVAVLEQGKRWTKEQFPRTIGRVTRAFWRPPRHYGFLEYRAYRRIDVIQGVGVGGGSLHYFNVHMRAPEAIFRRNWPAPLSRALLEPYYDRVQEKLESKVFAPPPGKRMPPRTLTFIEAAKQAGQQHQMLPIAVYSGPNRKNAAGIAQAACEYCGNCMLGCHVQAKNTLDITYLAEAESKFGAEVFPLHVVTAVAPARGQPGYEVSFRSLVEGSDEQCADETPVNGEQGRVIGRKVVVAAGALGSTELLLRCRDIERTLPKLGLALGTRFSGNGDFLFAGALDTKREVDPAYGPTITAAVDCSTAEHQIHIEDLGYSDQMLWFLEGILPPRRNRLLVFAHFLRAYVLRSLGLGGGRGRVSDELARVLDESRVLRFLPFLGMGTDAADGVMRIERNQLDIEWNHKASRAMFREMEAAMARLSTAAGGKYATSILWKWPSRKLLTAHPLGGCVMGSNADDSVVNQRGEVWGYPGLFVSDGAIMPSALSVNPSLTIGALAERIAHWIVFGAELSSPRLAMPRPAAEVS